MPDQKALRELAVQTALWARFERKLWGKVRRVVSRHMREGIDGYESDRFTGIQDSLDGAELEWEKVLKPTYMRVGTTFGRASQVNLLGKEILMPETKQRYATEYEAFQALLQSWVETEGAAQAVNLAAATKADLRVLVAAGEKEGLSVSAIARNMRKSVPGISKNRSLVISRTEVHNAASYANHHAAISTGLTLEHSWLAHPGDRTRDSHLEASTGEWYPIEDPFLVGDSQLLYPGDSSLGAEAGEIINCRCGEMQRQKGAEA